MSEDKYLVFYKDEVNQFHCYYPQTKEYVIRNTPDYNAHRFELMEDYSIDDGIKKALKRYSKDIKIWTKECKEDEYKIDYLSRYKKDVYLLYHEDNNNKFHCYYIQTKTYEIKNMLDEKIDKNADKFEVVDDYIIDGNIKKTLKKYGKDLERWIEKGKKEK